MIETNLTFSGHILVADDEKVNVDFFQVMLSKLGVPWTKPVESTLFHIGDYRSFPSKPSRFE